MARSASDYQKLLIHLLPRGKAWNNELDSNLGNTLYGFATEMARTEKQMEDLLDESITTTTNQLIADFELDFEIPEKCEELGKTLAERRTVLNAKLTVIGRPDKNYFIEMANKLGHSIFIIEHKPLWCGVGACGDPIGDNKIMFYWTMAIRFSNADVQHMALRVGSDYWWEGSVFAGTTSTDLTEGKIFRTADYGISWTVPSLQDYKILSSTYLGNGIILVGNSEGSVIKSVNYGVTWGDEISVTPSNEILSLVYLNNGIVLAGDADGATYKSTDYGNTWDTGTSMGSQYETSSLIYLGSGIVIAGTNRTAPYGGRIFRSTDYGDNW